MSDKLEKLSGDVGPASQLILDQTELLRKLNAAIDRINELEARYEGHRHELRQQANKDIYSYLPTTPPIPGGDDGK